MFQPPNQLKSFSLPPTQIFAPEIQTQWKSESGRNWQTYTSQKFTSLQISHWNGPFEEMLSFYQFFTPLEMKGNEKKHAKLKSILMFPFCKSRTFIDIVVPWSFTVEVHHLTTNQLKSQHGDNQYFPQKNTFQKYAGRKKRIREWNIIGHRKCLALGHVGTLVGLNAGNYDH